MKTVLKKCSVILQEVMGSEQMLILQMYAKFIGRLENRLISLQEAQGWTFEELMCFKFQVLYDPAVFLLSPFAKNLHFKQF